MEAGAVSTGAGENGQMCIRDRANGRADLQSVERERRKAALDQKLQRVCQQKSTLEEQLQKLKDQKKSLQLQAARQEGSGEDVYKRQTQDLPLKEMKYTMYATKQSTWRAYGQAANW